MRPLAAIVSSLACTLLAAASARAEGLVQITLLGEITAPGGAPVEVELEVWDGEQVDALALNLHLGRGTRAHDLASLIATRLRRLEARVDFPDEHAGDAREAHETTLFIQSVTSVNLRLGYGMQARVTLCDAAPSSVRFLTPQVKPEAAEILIAITTFQPHSRQIGRDVISLGVEASTGSAEVSEQLAHVALDKGWIADRPRPDSWSCSRTSDGATVTGCSFELASPVSDWRLEVKLEVPQPSALDD